MTSTTLREMLVKQEPRSVSYCYVCSGPRADYMLFSKPFGDRPFFPFLEHHQAPESAETMKPDGRVFACLVCYTLLTQQWDSYEKSKTPQNKRIYWLKRLDGGPFAGMDLNLQQDYESLFEASNAAVEQADVRPKQKNIRGHNMLTMDVKPKLNDHMEQGFPGGFGFVNQGGETVATNILDLSMSTRTPSRSSSSASPGMNAEACYLCGQESKIVNNVFAKPIANCPYFPSIAVHPKPPNAKPMDANGRVLACEQCHKVLLQQWDCYQRQNVPHSERVYQLRAPDIVVKSEPKDKTFTCYTCGMISQVSVQRFISAFPEKEGDPYFSFLLNHMPHPGANKLVDGKAAVCSLCYKTLFRQLRVYEVSDTPEERRKYKILNDSVVENFSVLRQHLKSGGQPREPDSKPVCYVCESPNDVVFFVNSLANGEMFFPFLRNLPKPTSGAPIDDQGRIKICGQCHKSLTYQWDAFEHALIPINQRQYKIANSKDFSIESSGQPYPLETSRVGGIVREEVQDVKRVANDSCSLCEKPLSSDNACFIETMPNEKSMYFPSIRLLIKPGSTSGMDQFGRILACNQCQSILKNQWEVFESAHVPHTQRQYEIFPPQREHVLHFNNDPHLAGASSALHIQVSSPDLKVDLTKHSSGIEPLLTTVNTLPSSTMTVTNAQLSGPGPRIAEVKPIPVKPQSNPDEPMPRICGPLDVPFVRPILLGPINCFVCGEHNASGLIYAIKSLPTVPIGVDKPPEDVPFFPFLSKHPAPDGAEKIANDGSALVCVFCYHSLISQWLAYESSPFPEDANRWHRRYNTHNYVCYICGITTYRKRVCTISVRDFPFLLEHSRPPGALTVLNGECVVTCQTCYESITSQWKDFERMKVPVEMRKYNWIVMPPPPDDENSRGCQILSESGGSKTCRLRLRKTNFNICFFPGIPHGLKPPPPHLGMPPAPYGLSKPVVRNVMSPVHQGNSLPNAGFSPFGNNVNSALNATRTSSFAAALRKLAKQAVDPSTEKDLSPISPAASPSSSQPSSTHPRHHGPPVPMYMNSHSSAPPHHGSSPPIGSVPPLQSSQGKALDLGRYSSSGRNGNGPESSVVKMENSKYISSSTDKRMESGSGNKYLSSGIPMNAHHEHPSSRGFQPYRNSEERRPTPPQMYNPSPPPTTMSGYAYHPSHPLSSQMPPQPYRLEESVYMERYGLLRPSVMPYPPSSNMLSHPRAPLYPASHYPPELLPQSMRSLPPSNSATYPPSRYAQEEENSSDSREMLRKREMEMYRERERYEEERENANRELEYLRKERAHMRQSPISIPHSTTRSEMQMEEKGHMGSITHGTPRDYIRRPSPPTSSVPLNLATNVNSVEHEMKAKEEYNSRHQRHHNNSVANGQLHHRSKNHHVYRKESDAPPYKIQYHLNSVSYHQKQPSNPESSENKTSVPSKIFPYYVEQDYQKSDVIETRTLSMASVINSQINGIFAREKFPSNNSYDYFNFPPSSETQSKPKAESKANLPSRESFVIQTKSSNDDKYENLDSGSNKIHFVKSEQAVSHNESTKFAPIYKPREASLTRALLQNHVVPPSYRNESSALEEVGPKVVSTLDLREVRMRKRRQAPDFVESEESEPDSDEEDALRYKRLLTITKGPPVKIAMDPKKTKFLAYFGLTTHTRKQIIEIKKWVRRHQILREKSCSPVFEKPKEPVIEYDEKHLAELSKRLCFAEDFGAKTEFFKMFGLMFVPPEQKEEKEKIQKVVETEKLRRHGYLPPSDLCIELQGHHLKKRGYNNLNVSKLTNAKRPNLGPCDNDSARQNGPSEKSSKLQTSSAPKLSAFLKPPSRTPVTLPVPPLIPSNQVVTITEPPKDSIKNVITSKDPRVRQINMDFVQEFHKSVLQTTQMQLAEKKNLPSNVHMEPSIKLSPVSSPEKDDWSPEEPRSNFHWPGIEAIMESYECHISEQTAEKKFLIDSCQNLKALIQESNIQIECLERKTKEKLQEKQQLDFETQKLQKSLETLKSFIQRFR
ncbi:uncharacterized protein LOC129232455 [Uloborus diversus]|uniref:uncharacterized protein LOC129232455 n=1 Tax=Uloborus diversus TaxID=327109 RepID=UPI00240A69EB|nr:uncharacterized protein LOC129232455 [Uloborus diversus]